MLPFGYRFDPTDEELINGYLLRKAMDQPLPWNGILERNIYGEKNASWDVLGDILEDNVTKKIMYVFKKLVKVSPKSKRISRTAGCGTWSGQTGAKKIKNSTAGEVIVSTRMFQFEPDSTLFGHWLMHEYSLDGVSLTANKIVNNDLVLCKITRVLKSQNQERVVSTSSSNKKRTSEEDVIENDQFAKKQRLTSTPNPSDDFYDIDHVLANLENIDLDAMFKWLDDVPLPPFAV